MLGKIRDTNGDLEVVAPWGVSLLKSGRISVLAFNNDYLFLSFGTFTLISMRLSIRSIFSLGAASFNEGYFFLRASSN